MRGWQPQYEPRRPAPPFTYVTILLVGVVVEIIRYLLHPEIYRILQFPILLPVASIAATGALHLWSLPETLPKIAVSAFFTQAPMADLLLITWAFFREVGFALAHAVLTSLGKLTEIHQ